jgi:type-F conjugative transfer system pilin assembly protein TrbC
VWSSYKYVLVMGLAVVLTASVAADVAPSAPPTNPNAPVVPGNVAKYANPEEVANAARAAREARMRGASAASQVTPGTVADMEQVKAMAKDGQRRGREEMERLRREGQLRQLADKTKEYVSPEQASVSVASRDEPIGRPDVEGRVVVALSSSMPRQMLRDYLEQLDNIPEAVVVLRGAVGGVQEIKPTMLWAADVRKTDPNCVRKCKHHNVQMIVDPLLYRALKIDKVPAVAYLHGVQDIQHCEQETYEAATVVYGASSVEFALKQMRKERVQVPPGVLAKFERKSWDRRTP